MMLDIIEDGRLLDVHLAPLRLNHFFNLYHACDLVLAVLLFFLFFSLLLLFCEFLFLKNLLHGISICLIFSVHLLCLCLRFTLNCNPIFRAAIMILRKFQISLPCKLCVILKGLLLRVFSSTLTSDNVSNHGGLLDLVRRKYFHLACCISVRSFSGFSSRLELDILLLFLGSLIDLILRRLSSRRRLDFPLRLSSLGGICFLPSSCAGSGILEDFARNLSKPVSLVTHGLSRVDSKSAQNESNHNIIAYWMALVRSAISAAIAAAV